jgi:hypothetical protein
MSSTGFNMILFISEKNSPIDIHFEILKWTNSTFLKISLEILKKNIVSLKILSNIIDNLKKSLDYKKFLCIFLSYLIFLIWIRIFIT